MESPIERLLGCIGFMVGSSFIPFLFQCDGCGWKKAQHIVAKREYPRLNSRRNSIINVGGRPEGDEILVGWEVSGSVNVG